MSLGARSTPLSSTVQVLPQLHPLTPATPTVVDETPHIPFSTPPITATIHLCRVLSSLHHSSRLTRSERRKPSKVLYSSSSFEQVDTYASGRWIKAKYKFEVRHKRFLSVAFPTISLKNLKERIGSSPLNMALMIQRWAALSTWQPMQRTDGFLWKKISILCRLAPGVPLAGLQQ